MPWVLPRYWKKISPACGRVRSPSGSEALCTRCAIARCTVIGIWTGAGGALDSPCSPFPPPPKLVFDFDAAGTGGSHSGSLTDPTTNPDGWVGKGGFFPL